MKTFSILLFTSLSFAKDLLWSVSSLNGEWVDGWMNGWMGEGGEGRIHLWPRIRWVSTALQVGMERHTHTFGVSNLRTSHTAHVTCSHGEYPRISSHTPPPSPASCSPILDPHFLLYISLAHCLPDPRKEHASLSPGTKAVSSKLLCSYQRLQLEELGLRKPWGPG